MTSCFTCIPGFRREEVLLSPEFFQNDVGINELQ
jgi:hypothetical protein